MQPSSPAKMIITLVVVCAVAGFGLAFTYAATKDQIARQKKIDEAKAYTAVLPSVRSANDFRPMSSVLRDARRKYPEVLNVVRAAPAGKLAGYVIVAAPRGYSGPVQLAVGLSPEGKITDLEPLAGGNNETPGLGSQALADSYFRQFVGKTAQDPIEIGKDVDAISGATRSSVAVVNAARLAVIVYEQYIGR